MSPYPHALPYTLSLAALVAAVTLAGCAAPGSADIYRADQAQNEQSVRMATVESVRAVRIQNDGAGSMLGTLGGGALGAVAGSAIGGGKGAILTSIAGGLAGAIAGNAAGDALSSANGVEITVRLDNGDLRAITQAMTQEPFRAGDRVRLLSSGGVTRVTH